ncbi:MAG: hypothetical protein KBA66_06920 [Leptospiraceae bacterium]|nr:hypothetical protein [Leptospiraceae bacterium]
MITTLKLWIISCLLFTNILNSEELLQRGEAYILTESSWHEVKAREKESFKESKKEKRKLKKETLEKIESAEKKSVRYVSPEGNIFINKLYHLKLANEFKGDILVSVDDAKEQKLVSDILILGAGFHNIAYKLLDEKGKVQFEKKETIFLDITRPEVNAQLEGVFFERNSFYYYKPGVKLFLQARDSDSGVEDIFINLNRKGYLPMDKIDQPVDSPGPKEIKILATDKVTNLSQEIYLRYTVDSEPPAVNLELSSIPEQNSKFGKVCEPDTSIRLSAFDFGSGVSRIEFRKLGSKTWRVYRDYPLVPRNKKKISLEYRAIDNLGNESPVKYFRCKVKNEATAIPE